MSDSNKKIAPLLWIVVAFATVYIVWGSTYYFILVALKGFPPFLLGALRFIIAGILMLGWCVIKKEKIFIKEDVKRSAISGFFLLFMGTGAVIWVEQFLESAYVAILVSAAPIWFVLLDKRMWKENFTNKNIMAGLVIGFAGIILLFGEKAKTIFYSSGNAVELSSLLIVLIGMLSWCWGSLYSKHNPVSGSAVVNIGLQMLAAGIFFLPGCFLLGEFQQVQWQKIPADAWLSLFYLVLFGSLAGFSAYVWLLQVRPATQVSTYAYVNPVIAVLLGVFFAGEKISLLQMGGLVIILLSVLLINISKYWKNRMAHG